MILDFWSNYFYRMGEGIEYLIALGSLMGLLGIVFGLIGLIWTSTRYRMFYSRLLLISIVLLVVTGGPFIAVRYFRL